MPARQATLSSFFGAPPPPPGGGSKPRGGGKVQSTLSFDAKKAATKAATTKRGPPKEKKGKKEKETEEEEVRSAGEAKKEDSKEEPEAKADDEADEEEAAEGARGTTEETAGEEKPTAERPKGRSERRRDDPRAKDVVGKGEAGEDGGGAKDAADAPVDTDEEGAADDDNADDSDGDGDGDDERPISTLGGGGGDGKKRNAEREAWTSLRGKRRRGRREAGEGESDGKDDVQSERRGRGAGGKAETEAGAADDDDDDDDDDEMSDEGEEEYMEDDGVGGEEEEEDDPMADADEDEPTKKARNGSEGGAKKKRKSPPSSSSSSEEKSKRMVDEVLKRPPKSSASDVSAAGSGGASGAKKKSKVFASETKSDADLLADVAWSETEPVPYLALCRTFERIEAASSRLDIRRSLAELFRKILLQNERDLYDLIYLADNSVAPAYECVELGVGDSILIKAIGEASGTNPGMVKAKYESEGDLGTVAQTAKGKQRTLGFGAKPKPLTAKEVLSVFRQIATTSGAQSQKWKTDKIKGLLVRARGPESKYVIRGLQGKLRIGLAQSSVLVALAHAVRLTKPKGIVEDADEKKKKSPDDYPPDARKLLDPSLPLDVHLESAANVVKKAYSEVPSYDALLDAALSKPLTEMHSAVSLTPGIPVAPMLAKPTKSVQEVLKRLSGSKFTCEYKYDGERAQVHMTPDGTTKVFSRSLLDTSEKFPEVPLYAQEARRADSNVKSFVLDAEVVAYNRETKQFVPFQVLSTRKKTEESAESAKVQVIVQAFDLMYLNGVSLLNEPLSERRKLLRSNFEPVEGKFQFATSIDVTEEDGDNTALEEFLETAVKNQCEGLMVKTLDTNANYEPSKRSLNWLKLKKDYLEGLGDSVDLVPLGAYHGRGKRTGVYGAYLLGCYDIDAEEYQSVCKIGTGFSEEELKVLADGLNEHLIPDKTSQYDVSDALTPDVWFDAVQVWEVKAADLSKSSAHRGASGKTGEVGRGIGLRFPRFERVRTDKKPEQATTSDQILDMYYAQDSVVDDGNGGADDDDDGI